MVTKPNSQEAAGSNDTMLVRPEQNWFVRIYRSACSAITRRSDSLEGGGDTRPEAAQMQAKPRVIKTKQSIELIPIAERSMDDHLLWCIYTAKEDIFSPNCDAASAIRHMYLNLIRHPECTEGSMYPELCKYFILSTLGKSPIEAKEMALKFLNEFAVVQFQ